MYIYNITYPQQPFKKSTEVANLIILEHWVGKNHDFFLKLDFFLFKSDFVI